ncbi:MAG: type III secretion system chaperone [Deltaproteobacteria bacterium]|jgi:hypothetical protein|nr:type III secretion system chaperone [Deltaproteobacteria bacterium]
MNNARDHANELLRLLGEKIGLSGLALDEMGTATLTIDGANCTLHLPSLPHTSEYGRELYCLTSLGRLSSEADLRATVSAWLLDRNCFFRGVGPGVLGVTEGEDIIWYCARLRLDTAEYTDFEVFLLAVADMGTRLRRELTAIPGPEKSTGAENAEHPDTFLRV